MDANKKTEYDVIVIGAGMAGLLIAYYLQERGKKVLVLEANKIASGQTWRTTAKITSQHDLRYKELIETVGIEQAKIYAEANEQAINEYEKLIHKKQIACEFQRSSAYLYSRVKEAELREEADAAQKVGIKAHFTLDTELPFPIVGAVCFENQAQFLPHPFVKAIAKELNIWENTKVLSVRGHQVYAIQERDEIAKKIELKADKIVVATHYPIINVPGFYFLRQHQERSYVIALSGCDKIENMYLGVDEDGLSVRQAGKYILLGGGGHRTGKRKRSSAYEFLRQQAKEYFPKGIEEEHWSAQDCMPHDGIPFIGKYSVFLPHVYVATGFQKWGMTSSMVATMILRDELCGIRNPYSRVFTPQRVNIRAGTKDFLIDMGESVSGLVQGLFSVKTPRCKHMGCKLVWNPEEETWECPCHGSRFQKGGELIDNPAKYDLKK